MALARPAAAGTFAPTAAPAGRTDELREGMRLSRKEFHRRYELHPELERVELVGGRVCMPSPVRHEHSGPAHRAAGMLLIYSGATPGTESDGDPTLLLDDLSEPQPDGLLMLEPACGGRCRLNRDGYWEGPPDLVIEVAGATEKRDLGPKKADYARVGVREYLVFLTKSRTLRAFDLTGDVELPADEDGIWRSRAFPGLWLKPAAVFAGDVSECRRTLEAGLAHPSHAAFVAELARRRETGPSPQPASPDRTVKPPERPKKPRLRKPD